jgi:hypothetical protein
MENYEPLNESEQKMINNEATLRRLAIIQEAVDFELGLQERRRLELEQMHNEIEEELTHVETIVQAFEGARDNIKDAITEIEAAKQAETEPTE